METMKAVVKTKADYGAELQDKPMPKPRPDWVVVRVRATSICGTRSSRSRAITDR